MPQVERDDPIPPEPAPVVARQLADMRATIELYKREKEALLAQLAERDARDAADWHPLKRAASVVGMPYQRAMLWAARAVKAGRSNEAYKNGGKVIVNVTALRAYRDLKPPP